MTYYHLIDTPLLVLRGIYSTMFKKILGQTAHTLNQAGLDLSFMT